jgi:photosynthetic reaction center cytochrome c subunit
VGEFTRTMAAITEWVSPEQGCNYCHDPQNLASDDIYTKVVSRRMLQMTRDINANWDSHVAQTGVTCYSCHGGNPVPANIWFADASEAGASAYAGNRDGQNMGAASVAYTSLPTDPFSTLVDSTDGASIRVLDQSALDNGNGASIQATEKTYGLMVHMSDALGVNCTFCHNTNSFGTWSGSTPQRATAWHGLEMVKNLNENYLIPLAPVYPDNRLGPLGDPPKATCATCHQGLSKPLGGAQMAGEYPAFDYD